MSVIHVFIDANVYLSFYAYTDDNIAELRKIIQLIKTKKIHIHITRHVWQEYMRNRDAKLSESIKKLRSHPASIPIPRYMENEPAARDARKLMSDLNNKIKGLIDTATEQIKQHALEPDKLIADILKEQGLAKSAPDTLEKAEDRMKLGNPPGKPDSIGDRIHWVTLLDVVPNNSDLVVISKDGDFASPIRPDIPNSYLASEWQRSKSGEMHLFESMKTFLDRYFPDIQIEPDIEKSIAIKALVSAKSYSAVHATIAQLAPKIDDFSNDEARAILLAITENSEISDIIRDSDVEEFYLSVLKRYHSVIDPKEYAQISDIVVDDVPF